MNRKRTKIVATISDKRFDVGFLRELYEAGMNVVRINSAHLNVAEALRIIRNIREVSAKIAILIDTKGPEIRTTTCDDPIQLRKGETIRIVGDPEKKTTREFIYVTYKTFFTDIPLDSTVLIDDGELKLTAIRKNGNAVECLIENDGILVREKA
jgi:pyruvate kinase